MLVYAHCTFEFTTAAKQIAQCKMQFRSIRVALHRFNESINRLVLLLIEQVIQPFEIGFGVAAVFHAQLAQVKT